MEPKLVYQDRHLMVLDKPYGLITNRLPVKRHQTLQDWLDQQPYLKDKIIKKSDPLYLRYIQRSGIVHRLDRETSGLLVVGKTPLAWVDLQLKFKKRSVKKQYLALVHGRVKPPKGIITYPISRHKKDRLKFRVSLQGRPSRSRYMELYSAETQYGSLSLVKIFPETGRTHQIRVHFKHLGCPLVGDMKYLNSKQVKADHKWCPRLFLHAIKLTFRHPVSGKTLSFQSSLPLVLKRVLIKISFPGKVMNNDEKKFSEIG